MKRNKRGRQNTEIGMGRRIGGFCCKYAGMLVGFAFMTFIMTFCIYMFNLENKLLYYVVRPFLNRHYDAQVRDRRL